MSAPAEPWPIPVRVDDIGKGVSRKLVADEQTRARIAKALELEALNRLEAEVEIRPRFEGGAVIGKLSAEVVQICGVSLEPFATEIDSDFEAPFTTRAEEPTEAGEEMGLADLDRPDVIENGVIDLGHYVVEALALELDPFPRKPGAVFEQPADQAEPSPFAALAALKRTPPEE